MSRPRRHRFHRSGFTLLELLAVIAIIFVLLALLLPAASALRERSKMKQASAEAHMIAGGVKAYRSTYGKWPCQTQGDTDSTNAPYLDIIEALKINPRGIKFIEAPTEAVTAGDYPDPWGASYIIVMDNNEDGAVEVLLQTPSAPFGLTNTIPNETAVVISGGPDPANPAKRIYSWVR